MLAEEIKKVCDEREEIGCTECPARENCKNFKRFVKTIEPWQLHDLYEKEF